jgi:hypothetical protein
MMRTTHEVELHRQVDRPGQIGHEHERTLEDADEQRWIGGVVRRDVLAELLDAVLEVDLLHNDPPDVLVVHTGSTLSQR